MDWQTILSAILKWTWKQAFCVAAGGFTTLYGARHGYIEGTSQLTIAYLTFAATWFLIALLVENITKFVVRLVTGVLQSRQAHKAAVAKKTVEDRRAVDNLNLLTSIEYDALLWIYHRYNGGRGSFFAESFLAKGWREKEKIAAAIPTLRDKGDTQYPRRTRAAGSA